MNTEQAKAPTEIDLAAKKFEYLAAGALLSNVLCGYPSQKRLWYLAAKALRAQQERMDPQPLTEEQLKEMAEKPYYHVPLQQSRVFAPGPHWAILPKRVAEKPEDYKYGKTWLAYDHQPGEGQSCIASTKKDI